MIKIDLQKRFLCYFIPFYNEDEFKVTFDFKKIVKQSSKLLIFRIKHATIPLIGKSCVFDISQS